MTKTYWNNNGKFQKTVDALHDLIEEKFDFHKSSMPSRAVGQPNYYLERVRKAKNAYYRFNNDGDCGQAFKAAFGFNGSDYKFYKSTNFHKSVYPTMEDAFNELLVKAAKEQKIALRNDRGCFVSAN